MSTRPLNSRESKLVIAQCPRGLRTGGREELEGEKTKCSATFRKRGSMARIVCFLQIWLEIEGRVSVLRYPKSKVSMLENVWGEAKKDTP
eukprot:1149515-Pelagomonas_calceolata.AAC.3